MARISLPNGCSCTVPAVHPKGWMKPAASVKNQWYIHYRFYDVDGSVKRIQVKNMNHLKTLSDRREATKGLLSEIKSMLEQGYNPIRSQYVTASGAPAPVIDALQLAYNRLSCSPKTKRIIKQTLGHAETAIRALGLQGKTAADISRKDILFILDEMGRRKGGWTPSSFNHTRSYLRMLFTELEQLDLANVDFSKVRKMKETRRIRETLTNQQAKAVERYLHDNYYTFWRFFLIFFQSGCRIAELMRLKVPSVDLKSQRFRVTVKKGRQAVEVYKSITASALPLWEEIMAEAGANDYVFSKGLVPGLNAINEKQITRRWYLRVKKQEEKIGHKITADFYSLKHLFTTKTMDKVIKDAAKVAAKHNSHTSEAMVVKIYDVKREVRKHNKLKKLKVKIGK